MTAEPTVGEPRGEDWVRLQESESLLDRCLRQLNGPAKAIYAGTFIHEDIQKWSEARRIAGERSRDE